MNYENVLFYKQWKLLSGEELEKTINEFIENGKIKEDDNKNCSAKREFVTSCIHPLRLHYSKTIKKIYLVEAEIVTK